MEVLRPRESGAGISNAALPRVAWRRLWTDLLDESRCSQDNNVESDSPCCLHSGPGEGLLSRFPDRLRWQGSSILKEVRSTSMCIVIAFIAWWGGALVFRFGGQGGSQELLRLSCRQSLLFIYFFMTIPCIMSQFATAKTLGLFARSSTLNRHCQ